MNFKGFFALQPHQGKELGFVEALKEAGWFKSNYSRANVKFGLYDLDSGRGGVGWAEYILELNARGIPLFLYPHAARPMVQYDGIVEVNPGVRALFTHAEGGRTVLEAFGFEKPVEVVGWSFCKIRPFKPASEVKEVVFAPIHPNHNGYLNAVEKKLNADTFERIHAWCKKSGAHLLVRYLHAIEENGLQYQDGVTYYRGAPDQSTADIDAADLVIGHQTFAYLAVARGKPTLMMGENIPPRSGNSDSNYHYVKHWEAYKDLLMYPLDILKTRSVDKLIEKAVSSDAEIQRWREMFIGQPFDKKLFVEKLEAYL